jgi:hypothetical protein
MSSKSPSDHLDQPTPNVVRRPNDLLKLARSGRSEAKAVLASLSAEAIAHGCIELDAKSRGEFLTIIDNPEQVVPLLPETDFTLALNAIGKDQAGWLLAFSTDEQRVACIDMDCFDLEGFQPERMVGWIDALIDAGPSTLIAAFQDLDPEIWTLGLRQMAHFSIGAAAGDAFTEDGVVFYTPHSDSDFERVREILLTLFSSSPRLYWQLVYAAIEDASAECEEWAVRWRDARLADLGFPSREQAMWVHRPLSVAEVEFREPTTSVRDSSDGGPASESMDLVPSRFGKMLLGDALRKLPTDRASELLGYIAGVANALAIADRLELGNPDTAKQASDKALAGIERGFCKLVETRNLAPDRILDRVTALQLFRLGTSEGAKPRGDRL